MASTALWKPSEKRIKNANMNRFIRYFSRSIDEGVTDYTTLYQLSTGRPERFWPAVWEFCGIRSSKGWNNVLENPQKMPGAQWFKGSRLNFAQNLLRFNDDETALVFHGEAGHTLKLTYKQLNTRVAQLAAALRAQGVVSGDRVAGFVPNLPHTVIAMLATTS
ncbi:MAG: AMP-binding protein, partial [bacterium]